MHGKVMAMKQPAPGRANDQVSARRQEDMEKVDAPIVLKSTLNDQDLRYFEDLLLQRRRSAMDDIERMRATLQDAREQSENDTAYSFHMADAGTDAMEREKLYLMVARQQKYISYLDRALERIKNKTYGICKITGEPISRERLEAVPHTEISIEAKLKQRK